MSGSLRTGFLLLILLLSYTAPAHVFAQQTPTSLEYPYIYKSTRAMGMGGAYTAIGGRADTLFYNPAGLINIPKDKGWEVNLLNLSIESSSKMVKLSDAVLKRKCGEGTFCQDLQNAQDGDLHPTDTDKQTATNDVLARYRGDNMHIRIADFTSIAKSYDNWAMGVGGLGTARVDAIAHQGFGEEGLLEVNADSFYGALAGFSVGVTDNVVAGLSFKQLHRISLIHDFTARELVEKQDTLGDFIKDDLKQEGNGVGFDTGVLWRFAPDSAFKPVLGASIMNVGDTKFGSAPKIPQSVNLGIAVNPQISWARALTAGIDYIDVLNGYKQDKDQAKRLRYGAELQLIDDTPLEFAVRAGMYEGSPTAGFDLRAFILTVSYAMYTEELGAYPGQDKDKRQLLTLNIGW